MAWNPIADLTGPAGPPGSDADVTAHEAAGDPHPQYLTPTEGNAAYRPKTPAITAAGNVTTWTIAAGSATTGDVFRATGNTATTTLAVPTGTPSDDTSINLELLASTATSLVINGSILLTSGITTPIAVASGKRWFGGLRYVNGVGWLLLASTVQS